jgi:hypothetical protein
MTPYSSIWYSRHSGGIFFTYDSWPILMPEKNATSRDFRSRQIKRIDGLNRTGTGLRSNKPMAFLGTVPRSKKGLGTEATAARPTNGAVRGRAPEQQRRAQPTPPQIWSNATGSKKRGDGGDRGTGRKRSTSGDPHRRHCGSCAWTRGAAAP